MWSRAFLGFTCKSNIVDKNLCEAFNSSIVEARFKSIIRIFEDIRTKMMSRIVQKKKLCNVQKQKYGPLVKPINGPHDWEKIGIEPMLPPIERKIPRSPKKNRKMGKDESKKMKPDHLSRKGLIMTCTQCGQHGHDKRSCTQGNEHAK
ncbi:hypothetical protein Goarm_012896 [Gossypium armourianum]|uniref:CCHC-type domain-containing protein n=1 Tax=Gossypium armourianum TaxID=34283 RepID=A0A7J9J1J6_9ROSI|nr:hypothetical protein [Gossypium armourianum]